MRRLPLDSVADQLGKRLMKQRLPPPPSHLSAPTSRTGEDAAEEVTIEATVRLMQEGGARMVVENDAVVVHHSFANGRLYHMEGGDDEGDGAGDDAGEEDEGEKTTRTSSGRFGSNPRLAPCSSVCCTTRTPRRSAWASRTFRSGPWRRGSTPCADSFARASSPSSTEDAVRERFRVFLMVHDYTFDDASL